MTLRDEQNEVIRELSTLVDVETIDWPNGTVQVSFGRGKPLVIGDVPTAVTSRTSRPPASPGSTAA